MGKAKRQDKMESTIGEHRSAAKRPKARGGSRTQRKVSPLDDKRISQVAGIPDEAQINKVVRHLAPADRKVFQRVRRLLAEQLGSDAAARLWLASAGTGFETTALDAIRAGQAKLVLATLESQWGPSPTYA